jgi:hypothetical protein
MMLTKIPNIWSSQWVSQAVQETRTRPTLEETSGRCTTHTTQPARGVRSDWCRCGRSRSRVRRITDQPVIDINRHNVDEHECDLRGHTD